MAGTAAGAAKRKLKQKRAKRATTRPSAARGNVKRKTPAKRRAAK